MTTIEINNRRCAATSVYEGVSVSSNVQGILTLTVQKNVHEGPITIHLKPWPERIEGLSWNSNDIRYSNDVTVNINSGEATITLNGPMITQWNEGGRMGIIDFYR